MKRYLFTSLVLCSFLAFASSGWSLTINGGATNVGAQDLLTLPDPDPVDAAINPEKLANSGDATELAWANDYLGTNFASLVKTITTAGDWIAVDSNPGLVAFNLQDDPTYFFLKIGIQPPNPDHFLFTNNSELDWAVIALSDLGVNSGGISHVGELGGSTKVPEPGMLLLFGSGLLGLGIFSRKKLRK